MKGLNAQELGIAISSVDAVSASISMAFSDKDVLAARKLVGFGFVTQLAAYGVQAAAFDTYLRRDSFRCDSPTTKQVLPESYSTFYWVYWSLRVAASILPCQVAYRLTSSLNKIENKNNATRSARVKATALWRSLPATLATSYLIYASFALLHGISIFNILRGTNIIDQSWLKLKTEWGQSANAIIAIFAICHVAYAIYRLVVVESRDDDGLTHRLSGRSTSRAYPQTGWTTWKYWPWNAQAWPCHLGLDYSDHLLVDESMLERVLNPPLIIEPAVRKKLWQELMDGFTYNDPDGIIDCLDQGAPLDEPNDDGDYPVHLAARHNNTDILVKTRFRFTKDSINHDSLLLKNSASETPLEVACNANTLEAVRWIMERLPQTHTDAKDAVRRAFRIAILGEKVGVLKILQHLWPGWRALKIMEASQTHSPLRFALMHGKPKSAFLLINPSMTSRGNTTTQRMFELSWKLNNVNHVETIMDDDQDYMSTTRFQTELIQSALKSFKLDNEEVLELMIALEVEVSTVFRLSIYSLLRMESVSDKQGSMWEHILKEGFPLETKDMDSVLAFHLPKDDAITHAAPLNLNEHMRSSSVKDSGKIRQLGLRQRRFRLQKNKIKKELMQRGGCDWSKVVEASKDASTEDLEGLIHSERDPTMLRRMLSVKDGAGVSLLTYTISRGFKEPLKIARRRLEYTGRLLEHGSCLDMSDLEHARHYFFSQDGNISMFMLLAVYTEHDLASDMLRNLCSGYWIRYSHYSLIQVLLRSGANPTIMNKFGKLPRQYLQYYFEVESKKRSKVLGISRLDEQEEACLSIGKCSNFPKILDLLQRWEDYYNDPQIGKPSGRPDDDWKAVRDDLGDEATWAWLVEKNPEGYKVVED